MLARLIFAFILKKYREEISFRRHRSIFGSYCCIYFWSGEMDFGLKKPLFKVQDVAPCV